MPGSLRKRGRPPGPTKETIKLVEQVYKLRGKGWSVMEIAQKYEVTRGYIYHLLKTYEVVDE